MKTIAHTMLPWAPLVARILVATPFLMAAFTKITNFAGTVQYAQSVGLPAPNLAIIASIVIEIVGGLSILFGYQIFFGAMLLVGFTLLVSFIFHRDFSDQIQQLLFMKNMGIVAALLYMSRFGAGKFSIRK